MQETLTRRSVLRTGLALGAGLAAWGSGGRLLSALGATTAGPGSAGPGAGLPNFVIILTDDLGWGDLGCYGSTAIKTPNIDRLAAGGMRFTDFYACAPVCSPSRYGLLTGRYPIRADMNSALFPSHAPFKDRAREGFYEFIGGMGIIDENNRGSARGIPSEDVTLAEALRTRGYATGVIGKWHLGDGKKYLPANNGFDEFFGVPYSNDMRPLPLYRNETIIEQDIADQSTLTARYTEEALAFIEDNKDRPFFLYIAHTFPHVPLFASKHFVGKSRGGLYGDTIEEIDASVGEVMRKLEETGLSGNTVIVFTSDNGPWYEGSTGELAGGKGLSLEGGFRVPFVVRWPGVATEGTVCREPAVNLDLFPTFLAAAGAPLPEGRVIDGKEITGLLRGGDKGPHEAIYFYHNGTLEAIRAGKWKYHRRHSVYVWPSSLQKKGPMLFDLESDPGENYNVITTYPEEARRLEAMMRQWEAGIKRL
jgi:uncharacterized sulfatase